MKLLYIDCCISQRGEESRTRALSDAFLAGFRETHPDAEIEILDLTDENQPLMPFYQTALDARDALKEQGKFDAPVYALARQFRDADWILVSAPFWDLSFPAALRIYIEYISASGMTYYYDEAGCHGSCAALRLAYLTSGGNFEQPESLGVLHWKQLAEMFGIPRFDYIFAGGLDIDPTKVPELMKEACEKAHILGREF